MMLAAGAGAALVVLALPWALGALHRRVSPWTLAAYTFLVLALPFILAALYWTWAYDTMRGRR